MNDRMDYCLTKLNNGLLFFPKLRLTDSVKENLPDKVKLQAGLEGLQPDFQPLQMTWIQAARNLLGQDCQSQFQS